MSTQRMGQASLDDVEDELGRVIVDGERVGVEQEHERAGWAVYTGSEGECPRFRAYFVRHEDAEAWVRLANADPDSDDALCDPHIAPAAIDRNGIIRAGNHFNDVIGARAVAIAARLTGEETERLIDAARPKGAEKGGSRG